MAVRSLNTAGAFRDALRARLLSAVDGLLEHASADEVSDAIAAPTGSGALARLLSQLAELNPAAAAEDPLAAAQARTALWRQSYADRTPMLDAGEAMSLLGLTSTEALRKRDRAGTIIALPLGTNRFAYPAWQFVDGRVVAGLSVVRNALGASPPWTFAGQLDGLRDPNTDDAQTLRELLLRGDIARAVAVATAAGESGGA
jgi:hypothetical protein